MPKKNIIRAKKHNYNQLKENPLYKSPPKPKFFKKRKKIVP